MTEANIVVCALYRFVRIDEPETLRSQLLDLLLELQIRGTLLVAREGINGTVAGSRHAIDQMLASLNGDPRFRDIDYKESQTGEMPFLRTRVKLKKEIVTMGVTDIDPGKDAGTYVKPADWNRLIQDPEVMVIDTRNDYEVRIGSFKGAINPETESFREFPAYVEANLNPREHRKVAMFCTGGIRCEKSTAYLKTQGFDEVYHLQGGILKYLEEVPQEESLWEGECFVFDDRVTVDHQLQPGHFDQCHACRMPVSETEKQSNAYVPGVSCPHCIDRKTDSDRARFRERQKQMQLARERGEIHIGSEARASQQSQALKKRLNRLNRQKEINEEDPGSA